MSFRTLIAPAIAPAALAAGTFAQTLIRSSVQSMELKEHRSFREVSEKTWHPAAVPGCVHTDLMNNKMIPDPFFGTNEQGLQWIGELETGRA